MQAKKVPARASAAVSKATIAARAQTAVVASAKTTRVAATAALPALGQFAWSTPVADTHRSSQYGQRWGRLHAGIDFAGPVGTPLRSVCSGVVSFAGVAGGYGNKVDVTCWDGTVVRYGHMHGITTEAGARVEPGARVGKLGNTGHSTGPHLHLEVRPGGGDPIDPAPWLAARGITPVDAAPSADEAPSDDH